MGRKYSMYVGGIINVCNISIGISEWKTHFGGSRRRCDYTRTALDLKGKALLELKLGFTTADHVREKTKLIFIQFLTLLDGFKFR